MTCKPSATLILCRQTETEMQVYLLRRSSQSRFMPGVFVFPGGNLEESDRDTTFWRNHVDLDAGELAGVLGGDAETMLAYAVAAIRETWEEAGLLLATDGPQHDAGGSPLPPASPFARQIAHRQQLLEISKLGCWHHWITPELMPQRYETYFYLAPVAAGRVCRPDRREVDRGMWITPRQALVKNDKGTIRLSPPTLVTLHQLLDFEDQGSLMADARRRPWPASILPRLWPLPKGALILEPWDPAYHDEHIAVKEEDLENALLPVGAPFSRLWNNNGHCRPVK